jgi:hypothetical protein
MCKVFNETIISDKKTVCLFFKCQNDLSEGFFQNNKDEFYLGKITDNDLLKIAKPQQFC